MEKRRNTSTESPLTPMFNRRQSIFSVFDIKVLSFNGISCSMYL